MYIESSPEAREKAVQWFIAQADKDRAAQAAFNRTPAGRLFSRAAVEMGRMPAGYKPCGVAVRQEGEK